MVLWKVEEPDLSLKRETALSRPELLLSEKCTVRDPRGALLQMLYMASMKLMNIKEAICPTSFMVKEDIRFR